MKPRFRKPFSPKAAVPTEHEEQRHVMLWAAALERRTVAALANLFAIPNGGSRHIVTARRMKAEGVKPGVPDLFLAHAAKGKHGLFIEMKRRKGGSLSREQADWRQRLEAAGYAVEMCRGAREAIAIIESYLGLSNRPQPAAARPSEF